MALANRDDESCSSDSSDDQTEPATCHSNRSYERVRASGSTRMERLVGVLNRLKICIILGWVVASLAGIAVALPFIMDRGYNLLPVPGMISYDAHAAFHKYFPDIPVHGALMIDSVSGSPFLTMVERSSCKLSQKLSSDASGNIIVDMSCENKSALGDGCITRQDMIREVLALSTPLLNSVASAAEVARITREVLMPAVLKAMPNVTHCPAVVDSDITRDWLGLVASTRRQLEKDMPECKHGTLSFLNTHPQPFHTELTVHSDSKNLKVMVRGRLPAGSFWGLFSDQLLTANNTRALIGSETSTCNGKPLAQFSEGASGIAQALYKVAEEAPKSLDVQIGTGRLLVEAMREGIEGIMFISTLMVPVALAIVAKMVGNPRLVLITTFNLGACLFLSTFAMWVVAMYVEVSMFVPALMMALALAMSIDYSLFLLTRFQKETLDGRSVFAAVVVMMETSGRIVLISGVILLLCFASIGAFPGDIILSMGLGAVISVFAAMLAALTLSPAVLLTLPKFFGSSGSSDDEAPRGPSFWDKFGAMIFRSARSILFVLAFIAVPVGVFLLPLYKVSVGPVPCMPASYDVTHTLVKIKENFGMATIFPTRLVIVPDPGSLVDRRRRSEWMRKVCGALQDIAVRVNVDPQAPPFEASAFIGTMIIDGTCVDDVDMGGFVRWSDVGGNYSATEVRIHYSLDVFSTPGRAWIERMREAVGRHADLAKWYVDGDTVYHWDYANSINRRFVPVLIWMTTVVFVCMLLASGSVISPVRAVLCLGWMLVVCLGGTFGLFQLVLGDSSMFWMAPIIAIPMMIGLGFDYDIFYTEAVVERCAHGLSVTDATVQALAATANTISAAGVIMIIAFVPLVLGATPVLRQIGLLLILGVMIDCFVSTKLVVPAALATLGDFSFWPRKFGG